MTKVTRDMKIKAFKSYPEFKSFLTCCTDETLDFFMSMDYWNNDNILKNIEKSFDNYIEKLYDGWHDERLIMDAESAIRAKIEEPL